MTIFSWKLFNFHNNILLINFTRLEILNDITIIEYNNIPTQGFCIEILFFRFVIYCGSVRFFKSSLFFFFFRVVHNTKIVIVHNINASNIGLSFKMKFNLSFIIVTWPSHNDRSGSVLVYNLHAKRVPCGNIIFPISPVC